MSEEILSRVKGALIGSALGDTIGIYTGWSNIISVVQAAGLLRLQADYGGAALATEFLTPEQALQAYGPAETFSLVEPITETLQDRHRCERCRSSWA